MVVENELQTINLIYLLVLVIAISRRPNCGIYSRFLNKSTFTRREIICVGV